MSTRSKMGTKRGGEPLLELLHVELGHEIRLAGRQDLARDAFPYLQRGLVVKLQEVAVDLGIGVERGDRDQRVALDQADVCRLTDQLGEATRDHGQQARQVGARLREQLRRLGERLESVDLQIRFLHAEPVYHHWPVTRRRAKKAARPPPP